jgi:hypothetical protein
MSVQQDRAPAGSAKQKQKRMADVTTEMVVQNRRIVNLSSEQDPSDFTVKVRADRDIVISKPGAGFEVTYRREMYSPMLIASEVLQNSFDDSKVVLLAQAWKLALKKAKSLGWLEATRLRRPNSKLVLSYFSEPSNRLSI